MLRADLEPSRDGLDSAAFPARLADASMTLRASETTGMGGVLLALPLFGYAVYALARPRNGPLIGAEIGILGALFLGAAAGVGYEIYRWKRRSTVVASGAEVAFYRDGERERTSTPKAFLAMRGIHVNPIRALLTLAALTVLFLVYGASQEDRWPERLVDFAPGLYLALVTISFARSGLRCWYFHLPGRRTKALFARSDLARLGIR